MTLDSGFDSEANHITMCGQGLIPVIRPIRYAKQSEERIAERREAFELYQGIYKERYRIERSFAWED